MIKPHDTWESMIAWGARVKERLENGEDLRNDRHVAKIIANGNAYGRQVVATALGYNGVPIEVTVWMLATNELT